MIRAAVLCPGPSLIRTWAVGRSLNYTITHAVNRALLVTPTDWLAAGDACMFRGLLGDARPRKGVTTPATVRGEVGMDFDWSGLIVDSWEACNPIKDHLALGRPINWSIQAALCHAAELGAYEIDVYGADGAASNTIIDCTGYKGEDRSPERWAREADDLAFTQHILAAQYGVRITYVKDNT